MESHEDDLYNQNVDSLLLGIEHSEQQEINRREHSISISTLYLYYSARGYANYIWQYVSSIIITLFMTLITILLFMIDWDIIISCHNDSCENIFRPLEFGLDIRTFFIVGNFISSGMLSLWLILHLVIIIPSLHRVHRYIHNMLCIDHNQFRDMKWEQLVTRVGIDSDQAKREICQTDNILVNLVKTQQMDLDFKFGYIKFRVPYTSLTSWLLRIIIQPNQSGHNIVSWSRYFGILSIIVLPFTCVTVLLYFIMKQSEQLHAKKDYLGPRSWTQYAKTLFRSYNELPHLFDKRMLMASKPANTYLNIFTKSHMKNTISKLVSFLAGGTLTILTILAVLNDNVLISTTLLGRNLLSYLTLSATIFAISRLLIPDPLNSTHDPIVELNVFSRIVNYRLDEWSGREHYHTTYNVISSFYRYRFVNFMRELLTFLLMPYILLVIIPRNARKISIATNQSYYH